jgi:hypothetical protein
VRRTLYLMNEAKSPVERYGEIYGFDESQARGRPMESIPKYGNIQEVNEEVDRIIQTWNHLTSELDQLILHRQQLSQELQSVGSDDVWRTQMIERIDSRLKGAKREVRILRWEVRRMIRLSDNEASWKEEESKPASRIEMEENEPPYPLCPNEAQVKEELRSRIKLVRVQIHRIQKKLRRMTRLSMQEAYLQACSEFYLLRQQEEVDIRIAIEQARAFRREMGPTVNERELIKESNAIQEWRAQAEKHHVMAVEARSKRDTSMGKVSIPIDEMEVVEEEVEEEIEESK